VLSQEIGCEECLQSNAFSCRVGNKALTPSISVQCIVDCWMCCVDRRAVMHQTLLQCVHGVLYTATIGATTTTVCISSSHV